MPKYLKHSEAIYSSIYFNTQPTEWVRGSSWLFVAYLAYLESMISFAWFQCRQRLPATPITKLSVSRTEHENDFGCSQPTKVYNYGDPQGSQRLNYCNININIIKYSICDLPGTHWIFRMGKPITWGALGGGKKGISHNPTRTWIGDKASTTWKSSAAVSNTFPCHQRLLSALRSEGLVLLRGLSIWIWIHILFELHNLL